MKKIIGIASVICILDQIIKYCFLSQMRMLQSILIIPDFFSFTLVKNTGVAFSLFAGSQIPFILLSIIVLIILGYYLPKQKLTTWNILSFGLLFGGILGNLLDRIIQKGVIDYLDFQLFGYDAPIFNLADICVVVGAFIWILMIWKDDMKCKNISLQ